MVSLTHRVLFGGLQASLLLRRHRRLLWGMDAASGLGDLSPEPAPSPSPMPPGPDDPGDDPEGLPDDLVVPFILLACFLVAMAGLMSGLTLGLMSLDQVDIEILRRSGTEHQKRLAQRISPLLRRPHVLLVTLLVINALAAEALPLVLDRLADPATAIVVSVTVVLLFGEIIPQAACSRYGLQIGAYSAPFVQALIFLTAPVSFPIGWLLDWVLGSRHTALFRRAELKALVDIHREGQEFGGHLSADEVAIIKGALDLTHKTARDAMTPIDMVFMLPTDATLDEDALTAIMASGHSRIPVHRPGDRSSILGIMLVKELLMVDKDQGKTVGHMKVRSLQYVRADTPLYDLLKLFEIGRSHMAVLMQLKKEAAERQHKQREEALILRSDSMSDDPSPAASDASEDGSAHELSPRPTATMDDFLFDLSDFEPVGIITIEDVLEELLQVEILDETDKFVDNMQSTPVSTAFLMGSLPPHLRPMLAARALVPRIGGAAFMRPSLEAQQQEAPLSPSALAARARAGAAAPGGTVAAVVNGAAADGAAAAKVGKPPLGAHAGAASGPGSVLFAGRVRSQSSGTTTPPVGGVGGSAHAGLQYRQGAMGAALVAEALRREIAEQLAAATAASDGGGLSARGRSRSLSPLPTRRSRHTSRSHLSSPEGQPLLRPAANGDGAPPQSSPEAPLFPGLRRAGSGTAPSSGASTPRVPGRIVPLPPPPPRRGTSVTQRVQEQVELLQPLLDVGDRRASADE